MTDTDASGLRPGDRVWRIFNKSKFHQATGPRWGTVLRVDDMPGWMARRVTVRWDSSGPNEQTGHHMLMLGRLVASWRDEQMEAGHA